MSAPKVLKRYAGPRPPGSNAPFGTYSGGLTNEKFAAVFGHTIAMWAHIEDLMIGVLQDLLGNKRAPARQIFHSVISNKARKMLMLACLQKAQINAKKTDVYEMVINRFSLINSKRNTLIHGLWYTHESGRVFLSESALDDFHYMEAREVKIDELQEMIKEMAILSNAINFRRAPSIARAIASPDTPPPPHARRNKKAYRQSKTAKP